jgi:hypothetical protein
MTAAGIAHLKITLDDVAPTVMRRIEVPLSIRLDRLHLVLQAALGWTDSHLYEFRARDTGWGVPDPDFGDGPLDARRARLLDVLEDMGVRSLKYLYDFGDGWEHTVRLERVTEPIPGTTYPRLIEAAGRCPPEDVGGPPGYAELLDTLANPDHEQRTENLRWVGSHFDPAVVDLERLTRNLNTLAKRWSRPPASRPKRST